MKVTIIGAGNIGTALAARISKEAVSDVMVYTSKVHLWEECLLYAESMSSKEYNVSGEVKATDNLSEAVKEAEIVFITNPSFMRRNIIEGITPFISSQTSIVFVPGVGGIEFFCQDLIKKGYTIIGLDRVPCIARVQEYGKKVNFEWKKSVRVGCLNSKDTKRSYEMLEKVLKMECQEVKNYLTITMTPSNQILHTSRLYGLFHAHYNQKTYDYNIPFYGEWDDFSSEILLALDKEVQDICKAFKEIDMSGVIPLNIHYESNTKEAMTKKICSIPALKKITSPMLQNTEGKYEIDFKSRYFEEDFPYGLCIVRGLAEIGEVRTPYIDKVLKWYEKWKSKSYFVGESFSGEDLKETNIPQNFGIHTKEQLYSLYDKSN